VFKTDRPFIHTADRREAEGVRGGSRLNMSKLFGSNGQFARNTGGPSRKRIACVPCSEEVLW
jgi:hypothetical protein